MARYIKVDHVFELPDDMTIDDFWVLLIQWCEANGITTGGGMKEVDEEGNPVKHDQA